MKKLEEEMRKIIFFNVKKKLLNTEHFQAA